MDGNYNLRSRRNKKEDEDNLLPDDPLLPDGEEDPLFPSDDDLEACEVEDCKNQLPTLQIKAQGKLWRNGWNQTSLKIVRYPLD